MTHKTIYEALTYVAGHPDPKLDPIDTPVWELVCRNLYTAATEPDTTVRGWQARASRAQQMITDRKVGKRRAGTRPVSGGKGEVEFTDLTSGAIEEGPREL